MSRRFTVTLLLLLLSGLPLTNTVSQVQRTALGPVKASAPDPATEKKALDLLEAISDQAMNLHSPTNRVRAESTIADLLWNSNEKRARALFKTVTEQVLTMIADIDYGDQQIYQDISNINQQRQLTITEMAAHDPELALSFLRETRLTSARGLAWNYSSEQNMELQLAKLIALKDPAKALELGRASLKEGVTWNMTSFLTELQAKDPKIAGVLYREMVAKIKEEDLDRNQEFVGAAWSLISMYTPPRADEDTYRDLLNILIERALTMTPGQSNPNVAQNIYGQISAVMPQVEKYAPGRATELRQWTQNIEHALDPTARMYQELSEFSQKGTVEEILALTSKYPSDFHNQIYQNAAWKAFSAGDQTRARQIATDMIADPIQRRQLLDQFDNQNFYNASEENKVAEARRAVTKLRTIDRKVQVLGQTAMGLFQKGDKKGALELLEEARGLVAAAPASSMQLWAMMQLAQNYSVMDSDQAFAIMQSVITKSNELIAAAVVLDGFDYHYLKEGEWAMPGGSGLGGLVNGVDQTLANLVRLDFDRTRALADQIERPEIRIIIDLHLAQTALKSKVESQYANQRIVAID